MQRAWRPVALSAALLTMVLTSTACPAQTADCATFVACQRAIDPNVDTEAWSESGVCWSSPDAARDCDAQCRVALDALRETPSPPAACADDANR